MAQDTPERRDEAQRKVSMEGLPEQIEIAGPSFCEDAPDMEEGHAPEAAEQRRDLMVPSNTYGWLA